MPNHTQNNNIKDALTAVTAAAVTVLAAPVTLAALPTLVLATGVGGAALIGRKTLIRGKRLRNEQPNHQNDEDRPLPPIHNDDDPYPWEENNIDAAEEARAVDEVMATDMQVFIRVFIQRAFNNNRNPRSKGVLTSLLKAYLNPHNQRLLQNMITMGYTSEEAARKAAQLLWEIQTGVKTLAHLTDEEKILLKMLPPLRAGADVPWWEDDSDNDDDDADATTTTSNNEDSDDDDDTDAATITSNNENYEEEDAVDAIYLEYDTPNNLDNDKIVLTNTTDYNEHPNHLDVSCLPTYKNHTQDHLESVKANVLEINSTLEAIYDSTKQIMPIIGHTSFAFEA